MTLRSASLIQHWCPMAKVDWKAVEDAIWYCACGARVFRGFLCSACGTGYQPEDIQVINLKGLKRLDINDG